MVQDTASWNWLPPSLFPCFTAPPPAPGHHPPPPALRVPRSLVLVLPQLLLCLHHLLLHVRNKRRQRLSVVGATAAPGPGASGPGPPSRVAPGQAALLAQSSTGSISVTISCRAAAGRRGWCGSRGGSLLAGVGHVVVTLAACGRVRQGVTGPTVIVVVPTPGHLCSARTPTSPCSGSHRRSRRSSCGQLPSCQDLLAAVAATAQVLHTNHRCGLPLPSCCAATAQPSSMRALCNPAAIVALAPLGSPRASGAVPSCRLL